MSDISLNKEREHIILEIFNNIPTKYRMKVVKNGEVSYSIQNDVCLIEFGFERYEPEFSSIIFADPRTLDLEDPSHIGHMHISVLYYIKKYKPNFEATPKETGIEIAENFSDLLTGDFTIRKQYDQLRDRFCTYIDEVEKLPASDPIRITFDNWDIQWLYDYEERIKNSPKT